MRRVHCAVILSLASYALILWVMADRAIFKGITTNSKVDYLLNFNVRLSRDGVKETVLQNHMGDTKVELSTRNKMRKHKKNGVVESQELIFIDRKEYSDGSIQLDQTNIKQRLNNKRQISIESLQKSIDGIDEKNKNLRGSKDDSPNVKNRFLFAFRYYEQLTMATKNFLSFASLATATGRQFVEPFVNSSRFSGLRTGVSISRLIKEKEKFTVIDNYFDRRNLQYQLKTRGYSNMVSYEKFREECDEIQVVIHFLYNEANTDRDLKKWYKIDNSAIKRLRKDISKRGWVECQFVEKSKISRFLGKRVRRYVCVDPEKITTTDQLRDQILGESQCAAVIFWKGNGTRRTHFPLPAQITEPLKPVHLHHAEYLIDIANDYIRNTIKRPFVSVHVRVERHMRWKGVGVTEECIQRLSKSVSYHKKINNLHKVFLAHDLGPAGSDTLKRFASPKNLQEVERNLTLELETPFRFDPTKYNLHDRGAIAIVEMHILSLGESLFTLGKGNFQEWVRDLFLSQNAMDTSLVHAHCNIMIDSWKR